MRHEGLRKAIGLAVALAAATAAPGTNVTYYVDQQCPAAADANAGTDEAAPLKTIQAAVNKVAAGDTILIKAGVYREAVYFRTSGRYDETVSWWDGPPVAKRITLSADGDDEVIIDGSDPVEPAAWKPVEGKAKVYAAVVKPQDGGLGYSTHGVETVFWGEKRLRLNLKRAAGGGWAQRIPEPEDAESWCYDKATTNLHVNLGGADPRNEAEARTQGRVEAGVRPFGITTRGQKFITIRKLTVRRQGWRAVELSPVVECILEDCRVADSFEGVFAGGVRPVVRRCVVHDVNGIAINTGGSQAALIYDNVVYSFYQDWFKARNTFSGTALTHFNSEFGRFYNNVVVQPYAHANESRGCGFWPDCHSQGHVYVGNAVYLADSGFYIEAPAHGAIVQGNTCCKLAYAGINLSGNAMNMVVGNYCAENGIGMMIGGPRWPQQRNLFSGNWLRKNRTGVVMPVDPNGKAVTWNYAEGNTYDVPEDGFVANWANANYKALADLQKATGQETFGREARIDPAALGLVWVRVEGLDCSAEPIPMFGQPDCDGLEWANLDDQGPYFWHRGDARGPDSYPAEWNRVGGVFGWTCRNSPGGLADWENGAPVAGTPVGGGHLTVFSQAGSAVSANGLGWWSPSLPCAGSSTTDIALWMKTDGVKPVSEEAGLPRRSPAKAGAVVYLEWSDWTGQHKTRSYLVGGEGDSRPAHPDLASGTRDWTEVKGAVTAPAEARRMALFMGVRGCTGKVRFDAIRTFAARPGKDAARPAPGGKTSKPLREPNTLSFFEVDLSKVVNRALTDEQADDGKGGWSDQGPGWDMQGVQPGRKDYAGVPFNLLSPLSCVVLQSRYRPAWTPVPKSVTITVGRKADVLYFLHSGAWLFGDVLQWSYVLTYADGTTERIPVIAGVNVRDWGRANVKEFDDPPGMRTTVAPEHVANTLAPTCGMYITEWLNPHPEADIKEIEMLSAGEGVPILLAITGGVKRGT